MFGELHEPEISNANSALQARRSLSSSGPSWAGSTIRMLINNLVQGAEKTYPSPNTVRANNQEVTYVPTQMSINIQLLPVVTRKGVSQEFSLKSYANGNLLRGGYW